MAFLDKLKNIVADQFGSDIIGENKNTSLNLGEFGSFVDKSAERKYLEEGVLRKDLFSQEPKKLEILTQQPETTILIKKKMFSSLANNNQVDYMSSDEKLFYKASKALFKNKANQIASYERLSKIEKILNKDSSYTFQLLPIIISLVEKISAASEPPVSNLFSNTKTDGFTEFASVLDRVKTVLSTTNPNYYTTWITKDFTKLDYFDGTGVIELTNVTSVSTDNSLSGNSASLSIDDPYKTTYITEYDIEKAISDATNSFYNKKIYNFSLDQTDSMIKDLIRRFDQLRVSRGASRISFHLNPDTILSKRIRAIVDRIGSELLFEYNSSKAISNLLSLNSSDNAVAIANDYLINGIYGNDGLNTTSSKNFINDGLYRNESELTLFKKIISLFYTKISLIENSKNTLQTHNANTNFVRRKMRFSYLGKNIIQPMDEISIFISSKSKYDNKVLSILKEKINGLNEIQTISSNIFDIKNKFEQLISPTSNLDLQLEKSVFVGSEFPSNLWVYLRNIFISDKDGPCVFSGLAGLPSLSYNDGAYSVSVSINSKLNYLQMGKVNFNPGADNFNGAIFDPLTPFKTKFDDISTNFKNEIPQLLDENKLIIGDGVKKNGLLKFKAGPGVGQLVNESNIISDVTINPRTGRKEKYLYGPSGLVYNWKQGIGVYVAYGNSVDINDPSKIGNQTQYKNPFAGQDVMNVISLLVTGIPYNFMTYWRNVQNIQGYSRDSQINQGSSYFANLANELKKNNSIYGNFVPFKNLVVDEQAYAKVLSTEISLNSTIQELNDKLLQLTDIDNKLTLISAIDAITNPSSVVNADSSKVTLSKEEIIKDINSIKEQVFISDGITKGISIVGNDVSFESDEFINNGDPNKSLTDKSVRRNIRRKLNYLTRRLAWSVRANEDKNLFIVDDTYDKDFDISAFEQSLKGEMELYNNEFLDPYEKIKSVANLLNLEFFCDSQGHIRTRSPQYNKIPSSIFNRLIELKRTQNINLYPEFLENLFTNQLDSLKEKIEVLEDQLRLAALFINIENDEDLELFVTSNSYGGSFFDLLTNSNGTIVNYDKIKTQSDPDSFENDETLSIIKSTAKGNKSYFTPTNRADLIIKYLSPQERSKYKNLTINQTLHEKIALRIFNKTGQKPNTSKYVSTTEAGFTNIIVKSTNLYVITEDIANILSERSRTIKLLYESIKNSIELRQINNPNIQAGLLTPRTSMNSTPEALDHLIEDESYDDYGIGSGSRYILKNSQIISFNCSESEPEFTAVQVNGTIDQTFDTVKAGDLVGAINENVGLSSAFAVDYSLWQMYGLKQPSTINLPFLKDPQAQLAPYTAMMLSKARKNILRGTVDLVGNEYYQVGDVIFFEELGLLYYVTGVSHKFNYGSDFSTSLTLEYGHVPGDYIPNVMDLIGKFYYANRDLADVINYRQINSFNETSIGIIVYDEQAYSSIDLGDESQFKSKYSDLNQKTIRDILNTVSYQFAINNVQNSEIKATVELRIYYDSNISSIPDSLIKLREDVAQILNGTKKVSEKSSLGKLSFTLNDDWIVYDESANVDQQSEDPRSPSDRAISMAKDIYSGIATEQKEIDDVFESAFTKYPTKENNVSKEYSGITKGLYKYIIDCFVKFTFKDDNV